MTVPGRVEAASLLLSLDPPAWFVRHARAVAEVAAWLAARMEARGVAVDRRLVEAAALLHDADKALPVADPAHGLPHGEGSAAWLTRVGHAELARAVAGHPVTRLLDSDGNRRWAAFASRGGASRRLCRQAGRSAAGVDGCSIRVVASAIRGAGRGRMDGGPRRRRLADGPGPRRSSRDRRLSRRRRVALAGPPPGVDRRRAAGGAVGPPCSRARNSCMTNDARLLLGRRRPRRLEGGRSTAGRPGGRVRRSDGAMGSPG